MRRLIDLVRDMMGGASALLAYRLPPGKRQRRVLCEHERSPEVGGADGQQNLPESELVGLLDLIGLHGERMGPAAGLG